MELRQAKTIATKIITELAPYCDRIEVAGSIRRGRPHVHDIDIVAIPNCQQFFYALRNFGPVTGGPGILRMTFRGIQVEVYIATPKTWATLLLIRTGSKAHNVYLCNRARSQGMKLHADGRGLERLETAVRAVFEAEFLRPIEPPVMIPCDTETDIFKALGLPWKPPHERE